VLRHRHQRVIPDIAHCDAALAAGGQVDVVGAGRGHGHQLQVRQLGDLGRAQRHLVRDRDAGSTQALDDLVRRGGAIVLPFVFEGGRTDGGDQAVAVEEDDLVHGGSQQGRPPL
jgi:hypothetical protein